MISDAIKRMLENTADHNLTSLENRLKEAMQELALLGLYRANFFNKALFYGGSALRILFGLNRFSEDLEFSLLTPDSDFTLQPYKKHLEQELVAHGLDVEFQKK